MKRILSTISLLFILLIAINNVATCQISVGGIPLSLSTKTENSFYQTINVEKPDMQRTALEDELANKRNKPYRIGINIPVNKGIHNSGTWTVLPNGDKIWRLKLTAKDATALGVYYNNFYIPKGGKLFLYDDAYEKIIGAYTSVNNLPSGLFATELISGESITLEYDQPANVKDEALINISEVDYAYRSVNKMANSGSCEVNVNCSEGNNWKAQKQGVVKITVKAISGTFLCSGSVVNNTRNDYTPYVLTADHCAFDGGGATPSDLAQWIFYFNYEAPDCAKPPSTGSLATMTMTGATKMAEAGEGGATGSDFYLVLLNNSIPDSYNPFFIGWDRTNNPSPSGVGIHHPSGDIKKISTYNTTLATSQWGSNGVYSHWQVYWDQTANGHGVTEGGSSGSAIFDNNGRLIGTLTGGDSDCGNLTGADWYGKFYYHWDLNDTTPQGRLKDWLDPISNGTTLLDGVYYPIIDFNADKTVVPLGSTVNYTDASRGGPYLYQWKFEGAVPDTSNERNPSNIYYPALGSYNVTLKVIRPDTTIIKTKTNYIRVFDVVKLYPNPASHFVWLDLANNNYSTVKVSIYNMFGMLVSSKEQTLTNETRIYFNTSYLSSGIYLFRIEGNSNVLEKKIIIIHN